MSAANENSERVHSSMRHSSRRWIASATATVTLVLPGFALAAPAAADPTANLRSAIMSARGGGCPLRSNPIVEQANRVANESTRNYKNLITEGRQPVDDPGPGLQALGYRGKKSKLLRGWADNEAVAIKALLLQGASDVQRDSELVVHVVPPFIADCAFTDYGADVIHDETFGYFTSAILAGP
jgi:hypothetical protein